MGSVIDEILGNGKTRKDIIGHGRRKPKPAVLRTKRLLRSKKKASK